MPKFSQGKPGAGAERLNRLLQQALEHQQLGHFEAAERKCRQILRRAPARREALELLAIVLQQRGKTSAALHFMQRAVELAPRDPGPRKNLAELYRAAGDLEQARRHALAALEISPDQVDALFTLAAVDLARGQADRARDGFARAVELDPGDAAARNELGNLLCAEGRYHEAIEHYREALARHPEFVDCRINLADTLLEIGAVDAGIDHYRGALELRPASATLRTRLGQAEALRGDLESARGRLEAALELEPRLLETRIALGKLEIDHDPERAEQWFRSALDIDPKHAAGYYWLGVLFQTLGQFDRATNYLLQAIRIDPGFSLAWYRLSLDRGFAPDEAQIHELEQQYALLDAAERDDGRLVALDFALGRFHEQRGEQALAFHYFHHGNRIKARRHRFDRQLHDAQIARVIATFDEEFFARRDGWGNPSEVPVFIVGMPRSGTTLLERMLAAHSQMHGAGELPLMLEIASAPDPGVGADGQSHAERIARLERAAVESLAQQALERLRNLHPDADRIVDKLPGNYFRLGLIRLLFPRAAIVHCRRDPMDTCWSCYQQHFDRGLYFSNDLQSLGHAWRGYQRLMRHWHEVFPGAIVDVEYEDLVRDPEPVLRRVFAHCGLDWEAAVLDHRRHDGTVNTASMWQVRQPLYQSSIGRWRAYREYLKQLEDALADPD